jgi:PAS domain S-box-containing protein
VPRLPEPSSPPPAAPALPGPGALYRLLVEHVADYAILLLHPDGRVATWTEGAERMLGYTADEIVGRPVAALYPPEEVEDGAPARDLERAAREGKCEALGWRVRRDGSRLWATVVLHAIHDDGGRLVGFGQITRDLTARREAAARYEESRQRYRSLFEHHPDAVASFDLEGNVVAANPATRAVTGYDGGELAGASLWWLVVPADVPRARAAFLRAAAGEPQRVDVGVAHRDGHTVELSLALVPVVVDGAVAGVHGIAGDVTARKRAEAEREQLLAREREARAEAEAASRAKGDFLAVVTHELRTPLNAITGFADLLADGEAGALAPAQARAVERIQANAGHLLRVIEEVIGFARMEAGGERVEAGEVDLGAVLREEAFEIGERAREKGLVLRVDATACVVETDRAKVGHILRHLLSNAVKFTDRGEVRAGVRREPGAAVVEVRDTGPGIGPGHLERIWEPFWQAEPPSVRRNGGTGLGLSVARRLAGMLGGELTAESRPGEGSTFRLRLPVGGRVLSAKP